MPLEGNRRASVKKCGAKSKIEMLCRRKEGTERKLLNWILKENPSLKHCTKFEENEMNEIIAQML